MPKFFAIIFLYLCMGAASVQAGEKQAPINAAELSPEDLKVVAVMEILELMDLAEEMDMVKDINYLIEDDQNETQTD
jgi:hypothetical protein